MKDQLSRKIMLNRIIAFICLIIGLIYFVLIYFQASPREVPGARGFGRLTGRFFPELGGGTFLLTSAFLLLKSFLNEKVVKQTEDADMLKGMLTNNAAVIGMSKPEFITSVLITVFGLVYVSLIPVLGYLVATILAVFVLSRVMGNRNWLYLFMLALIVPSIIYYVFIWLLYVPLPRGFIDF